MSKGKRKAYKELAQRIEREDKLRIMQEKLEVRKKLMVKMQVPFVVDYIGLVEFWMDCLVDWCLNVLDVWCLNLLLVWLCLMSK